MLKQHNQSHLDDGDSCWESYDILPFTSWIDRLWQNYLAQKISLQPLILSASQELVLWEEILNKSAVNDTLLQLSETAKLAKSAWDILKQWQVDLSYPALTITEDSNTFITWAAHFQKHCQEKNWLDTNSLLQLICEMILKKKLQLPEQLVVTGFTEFTPLQKYLWECCETSGVHIKYDSKTDEAVSVTKRISLSDEETEIRTMARWAKSLLAQNPTLSIGCVVPHLEKIRERVSSIFSEVFNDGQLNTLENTSQYFNITAGRSLSTYPIICTALQILSLANQPITTVSAVSSLLLSPFLGDAEYEQIKRAQFDVQLRKANKIYINLTKLIDKQETPNLPSHCTRLTKRLEGFIALMQNQPPTQSISIWINVFMQGLSLLGWPGERSINSHEYQIVQRWLELLDEYQTFDRLLPKVTCQYALHYLNRLTSNTVFQPQGPTTSIQVLGILEAAGLPFDHTWVMGFDDNAWPPAAKPNPFIPQRLQATLQMPHSTAEHEYHYSRRLIGQLAQSTKQVIFSHAKNLADCELRVSPLIAELPEITIEELNLSKFIPLAERCQQSRLLELFDDTQAPAIDMLNIKGGASIFKLQAACPFKAFAEIRLNARPLESPKLGLTPKDRGQIVHKALELIWHHIKDSKKLLTYTEAELKNILSTASTEAIELITKTETAASRYFLLEVERLENLLWDWLQIEKSRPPFKVLTQEEERTIRIANLSIKLRIDRIDELSDGSQLIIDYKTGKNNHIHYWFGNRLDEPQLPLYCVTAAQPVAGIAFAEITASSLALKGISQDDLQINSIKPLTTTKLNEGRSWEQQTYTWHQTLEKLANEFAQGHAAVNPKDVADTCEPCHLHAFCRIPCS